MQITAQEIMWGLGVLGVLITAHFHLSNKRLEDKIDANAENNGHRYKEINEELKQESSKTTDNFKIVYEKIGRANEQIAYERGYREGREQNEKDFNSSLYVVCAVWMRGCSNVRG